MRGGTASIFFGFSFILLQRFTTDHMDKEKVVMLFDFPSSQLQVLGFNLDPG